MPSLVSHGQGYYPLKLSPLKKIRAEWDDRMQQLLINLQSLGEPQ